MQHIVDLSNISPGFLEFRITELTKIETVFDKAAKYLDLDQKADNIVALSRAVKAMREQFPAHSGYIYDYDVDYAILHSLNGEEVRLEKRYNYRKPTDMENFHFAYPPFIGELYTLRAALKDFAKRRDGGARQVVMSDDEFTLYNRALYDDWSERIGEIKKWKQQVTTVYEQHMVRYVEALQTWTHRLNEEHYTRSFYGSTARIADGAVTNVKLATPTAGATPINDDSLPTWILAATTAIVLIATAVAACKVFGVF